MDNQVAEPVGTLSAALAHAGRLLASDPALALAQAEEILRVVPGHPAAQYVQGAALRLTGQPADALGVLAPLAETQAQSAETQYELGLALIALGRNADAIAALRSATTLKPSLAHAWSVLADQLDLSGDEAGAQEARARQLKASTRDPRLQEAAGALIDNRLAIAERLLRDFLKADPTNIAAIRMLAEVGARLGRYPDSEALLTRCLELAPDFETARYNLAVVLHRQGKSPEALAQLDSLLAGSPNNLGYLNLKAAALGRVGEYVAAIAIYEAILAGHPNLAKVWMSLGHALKTVGRQDESIAAYERAIECAPSFGEAYWSLANLKTFRFSISMIALMRVQLQRADLTDDDRLHLEFALGKALEDAKQYEEAFERYARGAALRRQQVKYDPEETSDHVRRSKALFTPAFLAARAGQGSTAPDPIFIVGLPRAGSTLLEQILSSHSAVEGTMELPDIPALTNRLGRKLGGSGDGIYLDALADLSAADLAALGEEYLTRTRIQRKTDRPLFIDKMPNNFAHAGFVHLILPNAKIIDARRHPLACGFSAFKQHFARGQTFSYGLEDIGRYYADYVELMAHFDSVLPGRVHRVIYEEMVADPEKETRRLLDYCGLQFEAACLKFHENDRAVRTASSEQVRRPIYSDAVEHWRNYEAWLGPMKSGLGPVLSAYPNAPGF